MSAASSGSGSTPYVSATARWHASSCLRRRGAGRPRMQLDRGSMGGFVCRVEDQRPFRELRRELAVAPRGRRRCPGGSRLHPVVESLADVTSHSSYGSSGSSSVPPSSATTCSGSETGPSGRVENRRGRRLVQLRDCVPEPIRVDVQRDPGREPQPVALVDENRRRAGNGGEAATSEMDRLPQVRGAPLRVRLRPHHLGGGLTADGVIRGCEEQLQQSQTGRSFEGAAIDSPRQGRPGTPRASERARLHGRIVGHAWASEVAGAADFWAPGSRGIPSDRCPKSRRSVADLLSRLSGIVHIHEGALEIADVARLRGDGIRDLAWTAAFATTGDRRRRPVAGLGGRPGSSARGRRASRSCTWPAPAARSRASLSRRSISGPRRSTWPGPCSRRPQRPTSAR